MMLSAMSKVMTYCKSAIRIAGRKKKWDDFVQYHIQKAVKRKPVRAGKPENMRGSLFAIRNKRLALREGALRGVAVIIKYTKTTTGETKTYYVIPTSYRYKKLKDGFRKVLYIQDVNEKKQIKNFVLRNILNVALTDRRVKSNWPIEIE